MEMSGLSNLKLLQRVEEKNDGLDLPADSWFTGDGMGNWA
jgi:hypothetical protein